MARFPIDSGDHSFVEGPSYYTCQACGGGWFISRRVFRARKDRDLDFAGREDQVLITPMPTEHTLTAYFCADCGSALVRKGAAAAEVQTPAASKGRQEGEDLAEKVKALEARLEELTGKCCCAQGQCLRAEKEANADG